MTDDQHVVVNVEEQIAKRLYDKGFPGRAKQAIARAQSLANNTQLYDLEASRLVPLTKDEQTERQAAARADAERNLRETRDALLAASDWTQLMDVAVGKKWMPYRQKLRDLPANTKDPASVKWPDPPK